MFTTTRIARAIARASALLAALGFAALLGAGPALAAPAGAAPARASQAPDVVRSAPMAGTAPSSLTGTASAEAPAVTGAATGTFTPSGKNVESVTIDDATGMLNAAKIQAAFNDINFQKPTKVLIYARPGLYADNINEKTLLRVRAKHPEFISTADPDKWADGSFIITISRNTDARTTPGGLGQVGTYYGEDRKVVDGNGDTVKTDRKIQEEGHPYFKRGDWTQGVIAVAQAGAAELNRPWYQEPGLWITTGIIGGGAGIASLAVAVARSNNRERYASALAAGTGSLTAVTMNLDDTELSARALPQTGSKHAAVLEQRFLSFMEQYRRLLQEQATLESADQKQRSLSELRQRAETFQSDAADQDAFDDAIVSAAALYERTPSWRDAWRLQVAPVEEDLNGIQGVVDQARSMKFGFFSNGADVVAPSAAALDQWLPTARAELDDLNAGMELNSITTEDALDRLVELRSELSDRLQALADAQREAFAKSESERSRMDEEMETAQNSSRARRSGSILDVTVPRLFWSTSGYSQGYSSGVNAVQSSRSSASTGGSTSGYGGGGGSFSGAGSSSRF